MFDIPFPLLIEWYVWNDWKYTMGLYEVCTVTEYNKLRAALYRKIKNLPKSLEDYDV
jgi:hypothetical protein